MKIKTVYPQEEHLYWQIDTEPNLGGLISSRFVFDLKRYLPEVWKRCDEYREYSWQRVEYLLEQGFSLRRSNGKSRAGTQPHRISGLIY